MLEKNKNPVFIRFRGGFEFKTGTEQ